MMKYSDAQNLIAPDDLSDCFKSLWDRHGINYREEEILILINHFIKDNKSSGGGIDIKDVIDYCKTEATRSDWLLISKRIRNSVQKAYVSGIDIEQLLAEKDKKGDHYINRTDFTDFLRNLSEYGKLSDTDIQSTVTHFCRKQSTDPGSKISKVESGSKVSTGIVSLREFMAFLGKSYVGNLFARIKQKLLFTDVEKERNNKEILKILKSNNVSHGIDKEEFISIGDLENSFREFGVYTEFSHEQIKPILIKICDAKNSVKYTKIFEFFSIILPEELKILKKSNKKIIEKPLNAEELLRLLLIKVQESGLAVDEAFRHFDCDGNGFITKTELEEGLSQLGIFDNVNIKNWRNEIPLFIEKFDQTGNGKISLKDFFSFLGIKNYFPNIIQKMTKIFSLALEKGLTFQEIFTELDEDKDGKLNHVELKKSLLKLGTFGEISEEDSLLIIKEFDHNGDETISLEEFVKFFSLRISTAAEERSLKKQIQLINKFYEIITKTKEKGLTVGEIFNHFDKNKGGSVSTEELAVGMRTLPPFKALTDNDIEGVVAALDVDKNGTISLPEFEKFISKSAPVIPDHKNENDATNGSKNENNDENEDDEDDDDVHEKEKEESRQKDKQKKSNKEIFQQQVLRVSKSEGGLDAMLAYLDNDGDGLISQISFLRLLESENVYNFLDKNTVLQLLNSVEKNGNLSVIALLKMFDPEGSSAHKNYENDDYNYNSNYDRNGHNKNNKNNKNNKKANSEDCKNNDNSDNESKNEKENENDNENEKNVELVEFEFSVDPETRSLEKKLRNLGRTLCKKGMDVEGMFLAVDVRQTGMIRRVEFVEIMSELGLSILEKGKVLDDASRQLEIQESSSGSGPVSSEDRRVQLMQMKRLKGAEGGYAQNANRAARTLLMGGGADKGQGQGNFKVCMRCFSPVCALMWIQGRTFPLFLSLFISLSLSLCLSHLLTLTLTLTHSLYVSN